MGQPSEPAVISALPDGTFACNLPLESKQALAELGEQLITVMEQGGDPARRLFPTAYPDDPERDAGFQILAGEELMDQRRAAVATLGATTNNDTLTHDQLLDWMAVVNDLRLVLGTHLDVSEDEDDLDFSRPDIEQRLLYESLGELLHHMVMALQAHL